MMAKTTQRTCWGPSLVRLCWVWPSSAPPITCGWNSTRMLRPLEKVSNWSIPVSYYLVPVPCTRIRPPGLDLSNKETLFTQNKVPFLIKCTCLIRPSSHCRRLTGRRQQVECYCFILMGGEFPMASDSGFWMIKMSCAGYCHIGLDEHLKKMFSKTMVWTKLQFALISSYKYLILVQSLRNWSSNVLSACCIVNYELFWLCMAFQCLALIDFKMVFLISLQYPHPGLSYQGCMPLQMCMKPLLWSPPLIEYLYGLPT